MMNNLATKNKTDFTVTNNGDALISQRKTAELCGVERNSIVHFFKNKGDISQGVNDSQLASVVQHYANKGRSEAVQTLILFAKAGAKAYIYHEAGYVMKAVQLIASSTTTQRLADVDTSISLLERLGMLDDRDRLYYADSIRNAGLPMLPTSNEIFPVTISTRVDELGLKATNGDLQKIGKFVATLYKERYDEAPVKHNQYVQGAVRKVNSYTSEHLDIIDKAIDLVITVSKDVL